MHSEPIRAPSLALLLAEPGRAVFELGLLPSALPLLRAAPAGDGHAVMVLPGMAASDRSTVPLRRFLARKGYTAYGWEQGRNIGSETLMEPLLRRLVELRQHHGTKVSLVGWSLGGIYAREIARSMPEAVRCVITLGSPFRGPYKASNVWRVYELLSGKQGNDAGSERFAAAPPVPTTAIYTRSDGIVAWRRCIEVAGAQAENIEVVGSHSGLGHNALAMYAVADRLAQAEGGWRPFDPRGPLRLLYRRARRPISASASAPSAAP